MAPIAAALPIISAVAGIGGTALSVLGSYQQAESQKAQAEYQSDMAEYNAKVAEGNAQIAEEESKKIQRDAYEDSLEKRQEAAQIIGAQRAVQGASGSTVDVGSNLDLNLDTAEKGEIDALAIQEQGDWNAYNKDLDAWSYRNQGRADQTSSQMYSNKAASISPMLDSSKTLLSGMKKVGSSFGKIM